MRFLAPETAQAKTRQIIEDAKQALKEEERVLESVQNFRPPEEQVVPEEVQVKQEEQNIADTTEMPVVSEIQNQETQSAEISSKPEKKPVPIQKEEKKPAPISTLSESPNPETTEKNRIKVVIADILDTLPDEKISELCEKYTKNDKRWKRTRQIDELINAEITMDQLYS